MEACDLFSETMELHSEDVEYFYIESKRVTERRKRERDNLRREISILKEEKEELLEENQQLRQTNKQLKERLSVKEGKVYGNPDEDSNINTFLGRPLAGTMIKGKPYSTGSAQAAFSSLVADEELEFEDNIKFRSTLKDPVVFDPTVEGDSRLPKVTTELGSGEEKMVTEFREGEPKDVSPTDPSNLQNLEKPVVEQMQKLVFGAPNNSPKPAPSSDHEATLVGETKVKKRRRTQERSNDSQEATKPAPVRRSSRRLSTLSSTIEENPNSPVGAGRNGTNKKMRKVLKEVGDVGNKNAECTDVGEILEAYEGEMSELESTGIDPHINGNFVAPPRTDTLKEEMVDKENRGTLEVLGSSDTMTPTRKPTIVGEMLPKSSGKKKVRCKFGENCLGCPLPDCRECAHCLDISDMAGCIGKELFGKKVKLEVGDDGALILDLNDFRDLSNVGPSAIGQSKKRKEISDEVKFKTKRDNGEDDFEAGDLKVTGFLKTIRAPEKARVDGDKKEIEEEKHVKMEPFTPSLNNLSSFIVQVPSQSSKLKAKTKEKVSHLPPLPEESDLFQPPTGVTKGTQVIARELLLCLQNVDEGLVIELHHLAAELNVDVKKIFLVTNVLEAVGMVSRISLNKIRWEGEGAKDQSLVQLHQLAIDENVLGQIQAAELEVDGGSVLQEGSVRGDDKVKVTSGVVVQRVLMAFLAMPIVPPTMTTQTMAKVISSMGNAKCPQARLFELTNVLVGIGLLQKVQIGGRKSRGKSTIAYQYVGPRVEQVFMD